MFGQKTGDRRLEDKEGAMKAPSSLCLNGNMFHSSLCERIAAEQASFWPKAISNLAWGESFGTPHGVPKLAAPGLGWSVFRKLGVIGQDVRIAVVALAH